MARHPNEIHASSLTLHQRIAILLADVLGSPYTIYVFFLLALVSLPSVLATHDVVAIVAWVAQTFIQLVALAILQAKAVIDGKHSDSIAEEIFNNAVLSEKQNEEILVSLTALRKKLDRMKVR